MKERSDKLWSHTNSHDCEPEVALQLREVPGSKVCEFHPLEVTPEPFVWVEFGSIRREVLDKESTAMLPEEIANESGAMGVEVIPDENDGAADVPQEVAQEDKHLGRGDNAGSDEDKEPGVGAYPRNGGELRPGIPMHEDGGLAARRPGAYPGRHQPERRFIGKDQRGAELLDFFLIRGHSTVTQRRMAPSSRSKARLMGRWHDQPH